MVVFTRHAAKELGQHGIRVNCVAPATTMSERVEAVMPDDIRERVTRLSPLGRLGVPDDSAHATAFLSSDVASWLTGITLDIAGGRVMLWKVSSPLEDFPTITRRSVTMDTAALIKDMISDGRLGPGARLPSERTLSEALGVSRPSVREAIRSLVAMHILEARHGSGTYVSSLSLDELLRPLQFAVTLADSGIRDLFDVRALIEPGAAALAAQRATDEELAEIERTATTSTAPELNQEQRGEADIEWHDLIVRCSHNGLLINVAQSISLLSVESRAITVRIPGILDQAVEDHDRIAKAICSRKPAAAQKAMHRHLENVRVALFAALDAKDAAEAERRRPGRAGARRLRCPVRPERRQRGDEGAHPGPAEVHVGARAEPRSRRPAQEHARHVGGVQARAGVGVEREDPRVVGDHARLHRDVEQQRARRERRQPGGAARRAGQQDARRRERAEHREDVHRVRAASGPRAGRPAGRRPSRRGRRARAARPRACSRSYVGPVSSSATPVQTAVKLANTVAW